MTVTNQLVKNNKAFARTFKDKSLSRRPKKKLAVVACMGSRIDLFKVLGLENGEAHLIRNAGGIVTDDVVRSLILSQTLMGTEEIVLVHHTDCGLHRLDEADLKRKVESNSGKAPPFQFGSFSDPAEDVRKSKRKLRSSPFLLNKDKIRGFVYDVKSGRLKEV